MRNLMIALIAGLLMSVGISISQMINPVKVIAFLDFTGDWDPTLLVVMVSALVTYAIGYAMIKKRHQPIFGRQFYLPTKRDIDKPLVTGALLFGFGWGMVGYCPGPAMAALLGGSTGTLGFVVAMIIGFFVASKVAPRLPA